MAENKSCIVLLTIHDGTFRLLDMDAKKKKKNGRSLTSREIPTTDYYIHAVQ